MKKLFVGLLLLSSFALGASNKAGCNRLSKKDKQDLVVMFTEFIDGMERNSDLSMQEQLQTRWWFWETPMTRIEKSIDQLTQIANLIQTNIYEINHTDKVCCKEVLAQLEQLELLQAKIIALLIEEKEVLGDLDDESVGEEDFNSVADIDNAELSLISWLKSVYREQLKDKFIS